jgi:DNA-binding YbaB/EbfC family protein
VSAPDLPSLLAKAQEMQTKLAEVQRDLARRRVEASSGGGMVTAVATGDLRILEIRMEPSLVEGGDLAMLQDLTAAAVNAALAKAQQMVQEEMQRAAGGGLFGAGMPGGGTGGPGPGPGA